MKKIDLRLPSYEDTLFSTEEQRQEAKLEKVMKIPIDEIHSFKNHPFHVRQDEEMQKLIDSVQENGILIPVLVRPDKDGNGQVYQHGKIHRLIDNWQDIIISDNDYELLSDEDMEEYFNQLEKKKEKNKHENK